MNPKAVFKTQWLLLLLIAPLVDYLFFKYRIPVVTICFYLVSHVVYGRASYRNFLIPMRQIIPIGIIFCYFFSLITNSMMNDSWRDDALALTAIILIGAFCLIFIRMRNCYDYLYGFTILYFALSILIFFYRYVVLGLTLFEARGNGAFYGGNTAHFEYIMMFFLAIECDRIKHAVILFGISTINAVLFVSKGALIIQVTIAVYYLFISKKIRRRWKILLTIIGFTGLLSVASTGIADAFQYRFLIWKNSIGRGEGLLGVRGMLFSDTMSYFSEHKMVAIFGGGLGRFRQVNKWMYTNPHNLLLDVYFCGGVIALALFVYMLLQMFMRSKDKILFIIVVGYGIVEGVQLIYVDNVSKWFFGGTFLYLVSIYNILTRNKKVKKNEECMYHRIGSAR